MRINMGFKLGLIYLILIAIAIITLGTLVISYFEETFLEEKRNTLLIHANVVANQSVPYLREGDYHYLSFIARSTSEQTGFRIIVADKEKNIVADSAIGLEQKRLDNPQVVNALEGKTSGSPYYFSRVGHVYYLAVPIVSGKEILGIAFISADINNIYQQLSIIRDRFIYFGISVGAVAFIISLMLSKLLTVPLERLGQGVKRMEAGQYGYQVDPKGSFEIKELGRAFNQMSNKIKLEDEIRKQFVANASHELKSPLAAIKALLESVTNRSLKDEEVVELLADLNGEVDRLSKLVEDLLALSQIESGNMIKLEEVAVGEIVWEAVHRLEPLAQQKRIELRVIGDSDIYWNLDGKMMLRAIYNILDNGIKYSPTGTEVVFDYGLIEESQSLYFSVKDRGEGIPLEEREKIFQRFYRIDRARSRDTGGSGLGLALTQEIVNLHKGRIQVGEGENNRGAEFLIIIPPS
ncbi:signal transduction histidine kinase [Desulfitispora alkaliphila]|uniref:sensor histidine kinase n=1 Tax=Desulfitispora alkaliphila TaxID=622674 RepID=UPI003D19492C